MTTETLVILIQIMRVMGTYSPVRYEERLEGRDESGAFIYRAEVHGNADKERQ